MFRIFDTIAYTMERMWHHFLLVVLVLVGLIAATTLALSLTMYVDSVYSNLLTARLDNPPYAFRIRYLGAWNGAINPSDVDLMTTAINEGFVDTIDHPVQRLVEFTRIGTWNRTVHDGDGQNPVRFGAVDVGALEGAASQMVISQGEWPMTDAPDGVVPILIPETMFYNSGLQIGARLTLQRSGAPEVEAVVAAMWRAANPNDPAWIFPPKFFDEVILVQPEDMSAMVADVDTPVTETAWYIIFDGANIRTSDIGDLLANIRTGLRDLEAVLPGIRYETPVDRLQAFNDEVQTLTLQLFIIIAPVGGLVLYFVSMVAGLLVSRQQAEDVKLSSRGMSRRGVLTIHVLMWLLLAGTAFAAALAASPYVVELVGRASSFMRFDFVSGAPLEIRLSEQSLLVASVTGMVAASTGLFLAWRSTRQNVNSARQEAARARRAWWQRMYLDIMLLVPALYVLYTLNQQGGLVADTDSPFSDPLAFVGPTIFALGMALLFLRIFPFILGILARLIAYTRSITMLMAFRELTRSIGRYRGVLLMMSFTLSLTGFTASMASTLDRSLEDTIDYRVGADLVITAATDAQTEQEQDEESGETTTNVTGFNPPPMEDLYSLDGVESVSRVGKYSARLITGGRNRLEGLAIGVDRWAMAAITPFREDYASESLAALMNKLALNRTGVLIDRQTMIDNNLRIGQELTLEVQALTTYYPMTVTVMDVLDFFPTVNPADYNFVVITNLDPIFEAVGTALPFNVWMGLEEGADINAVKQAVSETGFPVLRWNDPMSELNRARSEPGRRGVLGFLSVGFIASIVLTLIATVIQNTASFRAQARQLGTLQAMGLTGSSVGGYMIMLQGTASGSSILSGTAIGALTTLLFLPLLDFSGGLPPYLVRVAWNEIVIVYGLFAGVFLLVSILTTITLGGQQLSKIVRLGEI